MSATFFAEGKDESYIPFTPLIGLREESLKPGFKCVPKL